MSGIIIQRPKMHDGQKALFAAAEGKRFLVAACGRRFGKTLAAGYWLALRDETSAIHGFPVAWCAPTYKLMLDVYEQFERSLKPLIARASRAEKRIQLATSGIIDFWTLEDPDAGRGRRYSKIVIDEAAMAPRLQQAWEQALRPTLSDYQGQAWFISTPKGMNYFHRLFQLAQNAPDWGRVQLPTSANPYIHPEELDTARENLPHLVWLQEYEAQFVTMGAGLIGIDMLIDGTAPPHLPVCLGVDLAISTRDRADWTAIAAVSRDPSDGKVYIREVVRGRWTFAQTLAEIERAAARWQPVVIGIEEVAYQAAVIQELVRGTKLPVRGVRPERDKVTRFGPLLTRFEQGLVRLDPTIPNWLRDELIQFPEGEHDDAVDALAMAFSLTADAPIYRYEALARRRWAEG